MIIPHIYLLEHAFNLITIVSVYYASFVPMHKGPEYEASINHWIKNCTFGTIIVINVMSGFHLVCDMTMGGRRGRL